MEAADASAPRDLYLRHTDKHGNAHVQCHRVWDGELLFRTLQAAAAKEGGAASVALSTEAEYKGERK